MPSISLRRLSKINVPLTVLWLASVVTLAFGYFLMSSSNSDQAKLYTLENADYGKLFSAQSGSTVGGMLIAVGVLGLLLALAAQTITRGRVAAPHVVAPDTAELADGTTSEVDDEPATTTAAEVDVKTLPQPS